MGELKKGLVVKNFSPLGRFVINFPREDEVIANRVSNNMKKKILKNLLWGNLAFQYFPGGPTFPTYSSTSGPMCPILQTFVYGSDELLCSSAQV